MAKPLWFKKGKYCAGNFYRFLTRPWLQFDISVDLVSNIFGCAFDKKGWHPIVQTLREYDECPSINYKQTTLYEYHKKFAPSSTNGFINSEIICQLPLFVYPWGTFNDGSLNSFKDPSLSRFCGPSTDQFILDEFDRIVTLYKNLKETGYKPNRYPNSYLGGTILKRENGAIKFVVMQGNHRMAVLSHLGYQRIEVRLIPQALKYVKEEEVLKWAAVREGLCTKDDALNVFNFFFQENGSYIQENWLKNA